LILVNLLVSLFYYKISFIFFAFVDKEKQWQGPFFFVQGADCQPGLTYRWTGATRVACTSDMSMT